MGFLLAGAAPNNPSHATTKGYVDQKILDSTASRVTFSGSTPATPTAGNLAIFAKGNANKMHLTTVDEFGHDTRYETNFGTNWHALWQAVGSSGGPTTIGVTTMTVQGAQNAVTRSSASFKQRQPQMAYASAGAVGSVGEGRHPGNQVEGGSGNAADQQGFFFTADFGVNDGITVPGARHFIGLTLPSVATNVEPSALVSSIGFAQLSTDSTQWYFIGAGTTAQAAQAVGTDVGAPTDITNWYRMFIHAPSSLNSVFYVQMVNLRTGVASAVFTISGGGATSPGPTASLAFKVWRCNNATALSVSASLGRYYIERD